MPTGTSWRSFSFATLQADVIHRRIGIAMRATLLIALSAASLRAQAVAAQLDEYLKQRPGAPPSRWG